MNLVLNASEAIQAPGKVRVEVDAVSSPAREAGWVRICVVDHGAGVAPDHPAQSADPFFTLKEQGQGLGLSSASTIARELGGKLEVDRTLGSGSRTTVLLPQASPRPERLAADRTPIPERGVALVVDDEEPVRAVLAQMLEQLGHRVILSGDGHEAIRALQDHAEDVTVVLLDLRMPGMDGWQCLRELRRIRADIPVLVCSGHDPYDGAGPGRDERLGYLTKPLRLADLRKALSALSAGDIA
jgi:CheY-like chemotaxis protein